MTALESAAIIALMEEKLFITRHFYKTGLAGCSCSGTRKEKLGAMDQKRDNRLWTEELTIQRPRASSSEDHCM